MKREYQPKDFFVCDMCAGVGIYQELATGRFYVEGEWLHGFDTLSEAQDAARGLMGEFNGPAEAGGSVRG